jgi:hypothetical protein
LAILSGIFPFRLLSPVDFNASIEPHPEMQLKTITTNDAASANVPARLFPMFFETNAIAFSLF